MACTLVVSDVSSCQTSLTLEVDGELDMGCSLWPRTAMKSAIIGTILPLITPYRCWKSVICSRTVHYPPKITLDFLRKCQFPKPFPHWANRESKSGAVIKRLQPRPVSAEDLANVRIRFA